MLLGDHLFEALEVKGLEIDHVLPMPTVVNMVKDWLVDG